jgi:hypothetical protein
MAQKSDQAPSAQPATEAETTRLAARRKLARAGLAAPVVLGTMASKPVLGAPLYHCTVSGHVSGGSPHEGDNLTCVGRLSLSRTQWLGSSNWPSQIVKGTLPKSENCKFVSPAVKGTVFNGFGSALVLEGLASTFFFVPGPQSTCAVLATQPTGSTTASMLQVLSTDPNTFSDPIFQLGRATVVSLLNYYADVANYPVTAHTIIAMFNATHNGGLYEINSKVSWNLAQVLTYQTALYPLG